MPRATDRLYSDTIITGKLRGATLVARERPTGETSSSPMVQTKRISVSHSSGTATTSATGMNSRKAMPIRTMPMPNFTGVAGWRVPSLVHSAANTGANTMMKIGLMELTHSMGMSQPNRFRSRRCSEYSAITVNCCWKRAKNTDVPMNSGMNAFTRERSSSETFVEVSRTAKIAMAATAASTTTASERLSRVMTSVRNRATTTATIPRPIRPQRPYCDRGSGSGTRCTSVGRFLRVRAYCVRPMAMPAAARPKPTWKPIVSRARPVSSGPKRAPMFTPM